VPLLCLLLDAAWQLALIESALGALLLALALLGALGWRAVSVALLTFGLIAIIALAGLGRHAPNRRFGPANALTSARSAYAALLLGILAEGAALGTAGRWLLVAGGAVALALDAVDGWLARRSKMASPFGARFDMESDALFVLGLSALVWRTGQAGAWVLIAGLLRYLFVLAQWLWSPLAAQLPASRRRKAICGLLIAALLLALAPATGSAAARWLALAGLLFVSYSFAADILYLLRGSNRVAPAPCSSAECVGAEPRRYLPTPSPIAARCATSTTPRASWQRRLRTAPRDKDDAPDAGARSNR
jgi:phosphatidylglycerophosphate synthase